MTQANEKNTISLRVADDTDASEVLRWRNQPHVRATMIDQDEITLPDHLEWWKKAKHDDTRRLLIMERADEPVAVLNYFKINEDGTGWWGFYLTDRVAAGAQMLAAWMEVEALAMRYAFEVLKLAVLYCETRATNEPVLMLHDRFFFETLDNAEFPNAKASGLVVKRITALAYANHKERLIPNNVAQAVITDPLSPNQSTNKPKLLFVGSANWDDVALSLVQALTGYCALDLDVVTTPFGQAMMQLMNPESDLAQAQPRYIVFCERVEDFLPALDTPNGQIIEILQDQFNDYISQIQELRAKYTGHFFVHDMVLIKPHVTSLRDKTSNDDLLSTEITKMNMSLAKICDHLPDCTLLPLTHVLKDVGFRAADPGKFWLMGRFPYGAKFTPTYHSMLCGALMALNGLTARAIVLDLDNTCWGGIVGDDGPFNIELGSDYPGNQFTAFQKFIKTISERGIILTVCSKNTESVAMEAFRKNSNMILCEEDFAAHRINWNLKSDNIAEIAQELDLSQHNILFIDDNPAERLEVRQNLPDVMVPDMPEDVAMWPSFLATHPALSTIKLLDQDRHQLSKYKIRKQIQDIKKTVRDKNTFLHMLGMKLSVRPVEASTQARTLQLFAKTNQFNTTTKRYSQADFNLVLAQGSDVRTVRIQDKLGSDEVIAALVIRYEGNTAIIENFVMSCRVLGRGVETAILADVFARSVSKGCLTVEALIVKTERNQPCQDVYLRHGFIAQANGNFSLETAKSVEFPKWFEYF